MQRNNTIVHTEEHLNVPSDSTLNIRITTNENRLIKGSIGSHTKVNIHVWYNAQVKFDCDIGENVDFNIQGCGKRVSNVIFCRQLPENIKRNMQIHLVDVWEDSLRITDYVTACMMIATQEYRPSLFPMLQVTSNAHANTIQQPLQYTQRIPSHQQTQHSQMQGIPRPQQQQNQSVQILANNHSNNLRPGQHQPGAPLTAPHNHSMHTLVNNNLNTHQSTQYSDVSAEIPISPQGHSNWVNNNFNAHQPMEYSEISGIPIPPPQNSSTHTFVNNHLRTHRPAHLSQISGGIPLTREQQNSTILTLNNNLTVHQHLHGLPLPQERTSAPSQQQSYLIPQANNNHVTHQPAQEELAYSPFLVNYLESFKNKPSNTERITKLDLTLDEENRAFKNCTCSIMKSVMDQPVSLHGHKYDFQYLESYIKQQKSKKLVSPVTKLEFTLAEIIPDRDTNVLINERILKIENRKKQQNIQCKDIVEKTNNTRPRDDDNDQELYPTKKLKI